MSASIPLDILLEATNIAIFLTASLFAYSVLPIYNLFYHPLRHIPGPRFAAASYLLEFYYDVILFGRYTNRIRKMHEDYGPIVRISPNEIHCNDGSFSDEIYAIGSRKRDKPIHQVRGTGIIMHATFSTVAHDLHRVRRNALAKLFSRGQVIKLEPGIRSLAARLCDKIMDAGQNTPFDVTTAYSLFTTDVISEYCFGERPSLVDQKGWSPNFREPLYAQLKMIYLFRFFPTLMRYTAVMMAKLTRNFTADMALLVRTLTEDIPDMVKKAQANFESRSAAADITVFGHLLHSDLSAKEKSVNRMTDEADSLLAAGTETVSWTLTVITYHLLTNPAILNELSREIKASGRGEDYRWEPPSWIDLEKLPYLGAVIHEGLRLSYGVASRTARIASGEDLIYRGEWTPAGTKSPQQVSLVIPKGFAIGMSSAITHHDEKVFPDSHAFVPERWLDNNGQHRKTLDRSLLAFSKGSRACIGMNLAYCEMYLLLALLTIRVFPRMHLYETTEKDVVYDHDIFNPLPAADSKGVRAVIL